MSDRTEIENEKKRGERKRDRREKEKKKRKILKLFTQLVAIETCA